MSSFLKAAAVDPQLSPNWYEKCVKKMLNHHFTLITYQFRYCVQSLEPTITCAIFNRLGVAGAVLQTALSLID